jgi:serine/threonine protein kinase
MIDALTPDQIASFEALLDEVACLPSERARRERIGALGDPMVAALLKNALGEPPSVHNVSPGTRVGSYIVLERLGRGGFGEVWRARRADGGSEETALKLIQPVHLGEAAAAQFTAMFRSEIARHAVLRHRGIVRMLDSGASQLPGFATPIPFFTMELCRGTQLHLACRGRNAAEKIRCIIQVCEAVQYAHRHDLMHLDLKPENILATNDCGELLPKVLDFGLARVFRADKPFAESRFGAGTLAYQAPEQIDPRLGGEDFRTDVHALGVILFQLLTDHLPYPLAEGTSAEFRQFICEGPRLALSHFDESLRGELDEIAGRAIEVKRSRRYDSPARLAEALESWLTSAVQSGQPRIGNGPLPAASRRRKATRVKLLATMTVLLLLAGAAILGRSSRRTSVAAAEWQEFPLNINGGTPPGNPIWHDVCWKGEEGWLVGGIDEGGGVMFSHIGHGEMLHTTDGGKEWRPVPVANFESGQGTNTCFFKTVWTDVGPIASVWVDRLKDPDGETWGTNAFVSSWTGVYFTTEPGNLASKWTRLTPRPDGPECYSHFEQMSVLNRTEIYTAGWQGIAHWKAGEPWNVEMRTETNLISDICFAGDEGWAVCAAPVAERTGGGIYHRRRGNTSWERVPLDGIQFKPGQALAGITVLGGRGIVFAVGSAGLIIRGVPHGTNWMWQTLRSATEQHLNSIACDDALTLWAVGQYGTIVKSHDNGDTWTASPCKDTKGAHVTNTLRAIRFEHTVPPVGWILGNGIVLRHEG